MEIKKARLLKVPDGYGLAIAFAATDKVGARQTGEEKFYGLIHPDLKAAWDRLKIHMAMIPGLVSPTEVDDIAQPDMELFDKFFIHAFSIGGDDDAPGVTLSGHWITYRGKAFNFHTPFELFDGAEESRYVYMDDCVAALTDLKAEIKLYLGGKRGEPAKKPKAEKDPNQTELFDEQELAAGEDKKRTKVQVLHPDPENDINPGGAGTKLAEADPEAQARVAKEFAADGKNGKGGSKATTKRRARQTADNPGGEPEAEHGD